MADITLDNLHNDLMALRLELKVDLTRLESKIDGKPSLMAMFTAILVTVFGMFGIVASTIATLGILGLIK